MYTQQHVAALDALAQHRDRWKRRNRYYHNAITRIYRFFIPPGASVLEGGCSTGDLLAALEPARGVGVDISPVAVNKAAEKHADNRRLHFIRADITNYSAETEFDYVVLSDTIGYLHDVQVVFENLRRLMTPRSRLVLNAYNFVWEPILRLAHWLRLKQSHPRQNWLSRDDIVNLLDLAGFEVVHSEGALLFPKYIPIVSALLNAVLAKLPLLRQLTVTQFIVARPRHEPPAEDAAAYTVSIVVPARNEAGNIEAAIARTPAMGLWTEFIFVEGHSQDNTWETIQRVQTEHSEHRIIAARQPGKGKKDAMLTGYAYCTGDIIMILDADLTMPPEELPKFYRAIASNKGEFINGVRLVYPMEDKAMRLLNLFGNKFFSLAFSYILGQPYKDTLCGTKVFWRHDYERMAANRAYFGDFDPFGDFDLIFGAAKLALKAVQMPIHYKERTYGSTQISRFSHGWLLLKMTWVGLRKFKWWV